jgi:hypothetical protein
MIMCVHQPSSLLVFCVRTIRPDERSDMTALCIGLFVEIEFDGNEKGTPIGTRTRSFN